MRSSLTLVLVAACGASAAPPSSPSPAADPPAAAPPAPAPATTPVPAAAPVAPAPAIAALTAKYPDQRAAIERGVTQVAALWRVDDGDLTAFCLAQFAATPAAREALFARLQSAFEQLDGSLHEASRALRWGTEVEDGPLLPIDGLLAAYDTRARVGEDLFTSQAAFAVLLNFPLTKLADRLRDGATWTRRQWAEARLAGRFDTRVPGALSQAASAVEAAADQYVAGYNLWMHHVLGEDGGRRFPANKRLISHWNLRDELKANYADKDGLAKQRTIARVMDRIVTQAIPRAVIDNPRLDWNPFTNQVTAAPAAEVEATAPATASATPRSEREPDTRFEHVLAHFRARRAIDAFSPFAPSALDRAFEEAEIPEDRIRAMLVEVLGWQRVPEVAAEIERALGRKLEPHDLWYRFGGGATPETELDAATRKRYPTAAAFGKDIPRILRTLGFAQTRAQHLAAKITVDPSRGAGHAMGAERRGDQAHLRTRVERGGMDYKGYNIAVHELGHNVEQTFSLYDVDYTLLAGVPNTAFTEALAFLFQARDLELLGRPRAGATAERQRVLEAFWTTYEIAGSALVEIDVWHWLYDHPDATAGQLREATVAIARKIWDQYYAPVLGGRGTTLLAIYSHTIASPLYLFNYPLGQLIAFQVEEHLKGKDRATFGKEFERIARQGRLTPDLWMQQATGKPVQTAPLLAATARALGSK